MIQHLALDALQRHLAGSPLYGWATSLPAQISARIEEGHGDLARWWSAVQRLPQVPAPKVDLAQRFALHSASWSLCSASPCTATTMRRCKRR